LSVIPIAGAETVKKPTADQLMPIQDLDGLMASRINATNLVFEGDRPMAWEHADDHRTKMIAWLKKQLNMD
jgi:hypothetical protein